MTLGSDPSQQPFDPPAASQQPSDEPLDASAGGPSLEDVVRETLDARGADEGLAPEVHVALVEVGRRHASQESLELAVAKELIDAVLTCRFKRFRQEPEACALASERIAQILWDDEPSRERLERLWKHLREESQ